MFIGNKRYQEILKRVIDGFEIKKGSFLITGATGMIGSFIIDSLLYGNKYCDCNYEIYALGRNREKFSSRFINSENEIKFIQQDICEPIMLSDKIDYIIHGASNADPKTYSLYPAETLLTNVKGAHSILEFSRKNSKCRLILLSTFEVYGKISNIEYYSENMSGVISLNEIRSCYPESKRCAEILLRCYLQQYGVDGIIARLCSVYGPTMTKGDSKAHAQFIRNALNNEDIILKSEGTQKRTYAYVADVVSAIFTIVACGKTGEAYNVCNENSIATIAEVAKAVSEIANTKVVFDMPNEIEERGFSKPQNCVLDNNKLKELGWNGRYSLNEGLFETIEILKEINE